MGAKLQAVFRLNLLGIEMAAIVQEKAVGYACLMLQDQNLEITADKIVAIAKAAGVTVEPIWTQTFENALKGKGELLTTLLESSTSGGGGGGGGGAAAATEAAPAAEAAAPAVVEESSEEEMELDLFG